MFVDEVKRCNRRIEHHHICIMKQFPNEVLLKHCDVATAVIFVEKKIIAVWTKY